MRRPSTGIAAIALLTGTACFYSGNADRPAHHAAYAVDAVLAVAGGVLVGLAIDGRDRCCEDPRPLYEGLVGGPLLGAGLIGAGVNALLGSDEPGPARSR
jgi:hypothetical protein